MRHGWELNEDILKNNVLSFKLVKYYKHIECKIIV